jgi:hypothetical protein
LQESVIKRAVILYNPPIAVRAGGSAADVRKLRGRV